MSITIELPPDTEARINQSAASAGLSVQDYVQRLIAAQGLPRTMEEVIALAKLPPGKTNGMENVFGKWPGDESDEEIEIALRELS